MSTITIKQNISKAKEKKLESAAKHILKGMQIIKDLGYDSYMSPNAWHIMNGPSHSEHFSPKPLEGNIVADFRITNISAGDW